jgi:RNA polymerase sigma-70 factor, ECF subfamily
MSQPQDPDAELMLRVKQGDLAAFEALVEKYKQPVTNLIYRTLPDAAEADDLAQNVFVQVYKSAHRYRVAARFSTWLFTIARNLCLNEIRRRSRHPAESLEASQSDSEDQPARQLFREEELSYEEISEVLGCSLSATKSLIHRARETLKQRLKPYLKSGVWRGSGD